MSGSIPVWVVWLAAMSVEGGWVLVGWWSGRRLPRTRSDNEKRPAADETGFADPPSPQTYSAAATASGVMT